METKVLFNVLSDDAENDTDVTDDDNHLMPVNESESDEEQTFLKRFKFLS